MIDHDRILLSLTIDPGVGLLVQLKVPVWQAVPHTNVTTFLKVQSMPGTGRMDQQHVDLADIPVFDVLVRVQGAHAVLLFEMVSDPIGFVLEIVEDHDWLAIGGSHQVFQLQELHIMQRVDIFVIGCIDLSGSKFRKKQGQDASIGGHDRVVHLSLTHFQDLLSFKRFVLLQSHSKIDQTVDIGDRRKVGAFRLLDTHADVADRVINLLLRSVFHAPVVYDMGIHPGRIQISGLKDSLCFSQAFPLIHQIDLRPKIRDAFRGRSSGQPNESLRRWHHTAQGLEALGFWTFESRQLIDHDQLERPSLIKAFNQISDIVLAHQIDVFPGRNWLSSLCHRCCDQSPGQEPGMIPLLDLIRPRRFDDAFRTDDQDLFDIEHQKL